MSFENLYNKLKFISNKNNINSISETNKIKSITFLSLTQLSKKLRDEYNRPVSAGTLSRYVKESLIKLNYALKRKLPFTEDRISEIVNLLDTLAFRKSNTIKP
jgi:hypothetical protein